MIQGNRFPKQRICRLLEVSRSNQYQNKKPRAKRYKREDDSAVLRSILAATKNRGTYGYPRVTAVINRERRKVFLAPWNEKRILRVMQMNKLVLPKYSTKPQRPHLGQVITIKSNLRYCSDILEIRCWNGEKVFVAFSMDCHDREVISFVSEKRHLFHEDIIRLIDQTVSARFGEYAEKLPGPIQWLSDKGPQYIANQTKQYAAEWGFDVRTTPSYSPESNGMAEAFVKLFKRDYVYVNDLWTAESVLRQISGWMDDYNYNHPHSGLKMLSPMEYRERQFKDSNLSV